MKIFLREGHHPIDHATQGSIPFIVVYDTLFFFGLFLLLSILLTAYLYKKIQRKPMWFMGVTAWVIYSMSNLMLLGQQTGQSPNNGVCLTQATFIYASPVLCSLTVAASLIQVYVVICPNTTRFSLLRHSRGFMVMLFTVPGIISSTVFVFVLIIGLLNPNAVERDPSGMYCHISLEAPAQLSSALTFAGMVVIFGFEALILYTIQQTAAAYKKQNKEVPVQQSISQDVIIRMGLFSVWAMVVSGLSILQYFPSHIDNAKAEIVQATLPCIGGLVFGTQKDLLCVWMSWARKNSTSDEEKGADLKV